MTSLATKPSVCWLPALPDEGWASMDRYWRELSKCAHDAPFTISSPAWLGPPPEFSHRSSAFTRAWHKHLVYPLRSRLELADLFHVLDHSYAHLIPHLPRKATVVATVFDLVPLEAPDGMSVGQVERFRRAVSNLRAADHLISISEETKRKLHTLLGIPSERITVAVPGMDFAAFQRRISTTNVIRERLSALPPIIFSVGSAIARKNLASLPAIFAEMSEAFQSKRCCFVRAGDPMPDALRNQIESVTGAEGLIELGPLFGDDLLAAFQSARVLIFPSTLEGLTFVIPEAMAAGCPVVTNTMTANPEAGGDAALYYTEGDNTQAASHLSNLLFNNAAHAERRALSIARAGQMTWCRHFQTVLDVYACVLHGIPNSP